MALDRADRIPAALTVGWRVCWAAFGALLALLAPVTAIAQPPVPDEPWRIESERHLDIDADHVTLSPDGQWLAGMGPDETICVWDVTTLTPTCAGEELLINAESVRWSPDSSAVAFALQADFWESDIFVFEREGGALRNLTDDGMAGDLYAEDLAGRNPPLDDVPAWSPDGTRLAFVRSWAEGERQSTAIMVIDRAGGEPAEVALIDDTAPMAVWTPMHWLDDGRLLYAVNAPDLTAAHNGVWGLAVDGGEPVQFVPGGEGSDIPGALIADVTGDGAIVYSWSLMRDFPPEGGVTAFWALDLETSGLTPLPLPPGAPDLLYARRVIDAGFSPDGGTMLLVTDASDGPLLMALDVASGALAPLDSMPREGAMLPGTPQWADNDTVLIHTTDGPLLLTLALG